MRRMATWGLALAVLLGGVACSDDDDGADGDAPATTEAETTAPTTQGPCPFVTTEAVAEAFSLPVELLDGSEDACDFVLGDAATLLVSAGLSLDVESCDPSTLVEVDGGRACVADAPTAVATTNEYAVTLTVTGEVAAVASRDALVRLIPDVTPDG